MKRLKRIIFEVTNYHAGKVSIAVMIAIGIWVFPAISTLALKVLIVSHFHDVLSAAFWGGAVGLAGSVMLSEIFDRLVTAKLAAYSMKHNWFR